MSSITILEKDSTSGGGSSLDLDVVFVPGFVALNSDSKAWEKGTKDFPGEYVPTLCTTVDEFRARFGASPAKIEKAETMNGLTQTTIVEDKSYIYANNLIQLGLPVMYMCINDITDSKLTEAMMMSALTNIYTDRSIANLFDKGEYSFKYLTSGGYPSFQASSSKYIDFVEKKDVISSIDVNSIDACILENFENHLEYTYRLTYNGEGRWIASVVDVENAPIRKVNLELLTTEDAVQIGIPEGSENATVLVNMIPTILPKPQDYIEFKVTLNMDGNVLSLDTDYKYFNSEEVEGSGLPSNTIATNMENVAATRGDCVALIDHPDTPDSPLTGTGSYFKSFEDAYAASTDGHYCAAFTPWVNINHTTLDNNGKIVDHISMPPSFAYLSALANSLKTNASWLAVAGAARGQIPNLYSDKPLNINKTLTNSIAEQVYQNRETVSINAITNIKPFGNRIWGNRTLKHNSATGEANLTATSFLNIRNMISDVKKVVYSACKKYTFEQNNDVLWANFKSAIEPTLNKMKTGAGLSGYKIIQGTTTEKAKLVAIIKLYPLYAVEDFEITVEMLDDEVKVS